MFKVVLYINGTSDESGYALNGVSDTSENLEVGRWDAGGIILYYNGTLDDAKIFDRVLHPDQINQIYEDTKNGKSSNSTIVNTETNPEDTWTVVVTPNDGYEDGVSKNASIGILSVTTTTTGGGGSSGKRIHKNYYTMMGYMPKDTILI